jgi:adenine deaminase
MQVALGKEPADLVLKNARLVNVYSGEILDDSWIAVKGEWIAAVGGGDDALPVAEAMIDAGGKTVIPGLIESHTHLVWYFSLHQFLPHAMWSGTTTIITESMETFPIMGEEGVLAFLDSFRDQPVKMFTTLPAGISISRRARGVPRRVIGELLKRSDVLGMGETYWQALIQDPEAVLPAFEETLLAGKTLEGHSAGARGAKLAAYTACGITSCHEPIDADQVMERLRMGYYVMIREGSIRRDLEAVSQLKDRGIDSRRLILVTDGISPGDLLEKGYMQYLVQKAIDCGWSPVTAVQMATVNPAERFGLGAVMGGIAPGRQADLVIIPDEQTISPQTVISRGRVVVDSERILCDPRPHVYPEACLQTIRLPQPLTAGDFEVPCSRGARVRVRVMDLITDLVTREVHLDLPVAEGRVGVDVQGDVVKAAAIDRTFEPGKRFVGFVKGFGLKQGAVACSAAWDSSDIIVVGVDDADMALAVNRIAELKGGCVAASGGQVAAEVPMPVFGVISTEPVEVLARQLEDFNRAATRLGARSADPLLTLVTLTGAAIPYLRICEEGLVNLKDDQTLPLFVA